MADIGPDEKTLPPLIPLPTSLLFSEQSVAFSGGYWTSDGWGMGNGFEATLAKFSDRTSLRVRFQTIYQKERLRRKDKIEAADFSNEIYDITFNIIGRSRVYEALLGFQQQQVNSGITVWGGLIWNSYQRTENIYFSEDVNLSDLNICEIYECHNFTWGIKFGFESWYKFQSSFGEHLLSLYGFGIFPSTQIDGGLKFLTCFEPYLFGKSHEFYLGPHIFGYSSDNRHKQSTYSHIGLGGVVNFSIGEQWFELGAGHLFQTSEDKDRFYASINTRVPIKNWLGQITKFIQ